MVDGGWFELVGTVPKVVYRSRCHRLDGGLLSEIRLPLSLWRSVDRLILELGIWHGMVAWTGPGF
jgi:hypothetical protein